MRAPAATAAAPARTGATMEAPDPLVEVLAVGLAAPPEAVGLDMASLDLIRNLPE